MNPDGSVAKPPADKTSEPWRISPCEVQPDESLIEKTHKRPMPLPFAIKLELDDVVTICSYVGHGQSKVAYLLEDEPMVL